MTGLLSQLIRAAMRQIDAWGTQEWLIAFVVAFLGGVMMLRGFGSRSNY